LAVEGLSCLLNSRIQSYDLMGIRLAPLALTMMSHLLFVDDSLLLFRGNRENTEVMRDVMNLYCNTTGQ
jgi:hypothetical protein